MIRPHTRRSRTHRTAEGDHRRSRTNFREKVSASVHLLLSLQNGNSCKTSCNTQFQAISFINSGLQFQIKPKIAGPKTNIVELDAARTCATLPSAHIRQHYLQSHVHCGNDRTVANHNGILSTAHARKTVETPLPMRDRSDHGPRMIRP